MAEEATGWRRKAFRMQPFNTVIKVGGSVVWGPHRAQIANVINEYGSDLLLFPGGGTPDIAIEDIDARDGLNRLTINRATLLAQDQTGLLLADSANRLTAVETLIDARLACEAGKIPVLLPSRLLTALDPFQYTGKVSSDTMSLWLAGTIGAKAVTLLKSRLPISVPLDTQSLAIDTGYVDATFPHLAEEKRIPVTFLDAGDELSLQAHLEGRSAGVVLSFES